jgi:hypothetical protein
MRVTCPKCSKLLKQNHSEDQVWAEHALLHSKCNDCGQIVIDCTCLMHRLCTACWQCKSKSPCECKDRCNCNNEVI